MVMITCADDRRAPAGPQRGAVVISTQSRRSIPRRRMRGALRRQPWLSGVAEGCRHVRGALAGSVAWGSSGVPRVPPCGRGFAGMDPAAFGAPNRRQRGGDRAASARPSSARHRARRGRARAAYGPRRRKDRVLEGYCRQSRRRSLYRTYRTVLLPKHARSSRSRPVTSSTRRVLMLAERAGVACHNFGRWWRSRRFEVLAMKTSA